MYHDLKSHYDPNGFMLPYTLHFYHNAKANLVRKYAVVYDAKNIDKYQKATPLPRIEDVMNDMPNWMTYTDLKELAAHCYKWRQK